MYGRRTRSGPGSGGAAGGGSGAGVGKRPLTAALSGPRGYSRGEASAESRQLAPLDSDAQAQATPIDFPHGGWLAGSVGAVPGTAMLDPGGCDERGVPAFTDGLVTHFASESPDRHVAAHEAAHQLQHAGVTRDAGLGAEGHAHAVAEAAVHGHGAGGLIGGAGAEVASGWRPYTELSVGTQTSTGQWKVGSDAKVGDQGRTLTTEVREECYADAALITEAAAILKAKKSGVEIRAGDAGPSGDAPDGSGFKSLVKVDQRILSDKDNEEFWTDCGRSSREVQGPAGSDTPPRGVYDDGSGKRVETPTAAKDPAVFRDEIYIAGGLGSTRDEAHRAYLALSPADKDAFDRKHKINRYAAPEVGEAFVARRDDTMSSENFNFHWGGVIMVAGGDRVTFENFAKPGTKYDSKDDKWYFETYGPPSKAGQTFHDNNQDSVGEPGANTTTMSARTQPDPSSHIASAASMTTPALIARYRSSADAAEKMALEAEMRKRVVLVHVHVKETEDWTGADSVYVRLSAGGRTFRSSARSMNDGARHTFRLTLDRIAPVTGSINVKVYDEDWPDGDDLISHIDWPAPYGLASDRRPWDGASYDTSVEFET